MSNHRLLVLSAVAALFCAATATSIVSAQTAPTVVIVVRHAEKDTIPPDDPPLTSAGAARALALDRALASAQVEAVITSQLRRTRETARPIAERLGLTPQVVRRDSDITAHARAVADAVRKERGKTVLVVGHGETIGPIIAALGGPRIPDLCLNEYSHLFVLVLDAQSARLVRSEYGAPSPPSTDGCVPAR
jgi:broad specificity phosphatase PhoE